MAIRGVLVALLLPAALAFAPASRLAPRRAARGFAPARARATMSSADAAAPVVLVTGASRGIGKAIALEMGANGCKVVVNYAGSVDAAEGVVAEIKAMGNGADAVALKANVGDPAEIAQLFKDTVEAFGACDVLVNNAGITKDGLVMRMKPQQWQDVIDLNLSGVFYCSQARAGRRARAPARARALSEHACAARRSLRRRSRPCRRRARAASSTSRRSSASSATRARRTTRPRRAASRA